jgi:hypothetical protein
MHVHRNSVEHAYGICATKGHLFMCHFMSSENNIKEDLRALLINYQILLVHFEKKITKILREPERCNIAMKGKQ